MQRTPRCRVLGAARQCPECVHEPRSSGRSGPDKNPPAMTQLTFKAVYEPAGYWLQTRIGPEER